jgi:hypothetical protein
MFMTEDDKIDFENAEICHICEVEFRDGHERNVKLETMTT